ncbi:MAG: hypothetical protein ACT4OZ_17235 [Gemmatimonadota bacterium]
MFAPTSQFSRRARAVFSVAILTGLVACEQATGLDADARLDTEQVLDDYKAMQDVFATSGWAGLQALGGRTPLATSGTVRSLRGLPSLAQRGTGREFATGFFRELRSARSGNTAAVRVISATHLGKTLVYDPGADRYVISNRTGAPANGARFVLYETAAGGRPIVSEEIGYADLIDEGANSGSAIVLKLVVVQDGRTLIEYRTRADLGAETAELDVNGYVQDVKGNKLTFSIGVDARNSSGETLIDADFDISLHPNDLQATGRVRGVRENNGGGGKIDLTIRHGANRLVVVMEEKNGQLEGVIRFNGNVFATASGDPRSPTLRNGNGQPLTDGELAVVALVVVWADDVFNLVEDLVRPVGGLLLLGWIL